MKIKRLFSLVLTAAALFAAVPQAEAGKFIEIKGHDLVKPDGSKLYIRGTNLGNWLNPEGYMFGFQ